MRAAVAAVAETIDVTADTLLACVCEALTEANMPVCDCYTTTGPPVIGPLCCECETDPDTPEGVTASGEAIVYFEQMYPAEPDTLQPVSRVGPCKRGTTAADYTVIVTHCYPTIDENGEQPPAEDVAAATAEVHAMVKTLWKALGCGCIAARLIVRNVAVDRPPESGCSVIAARVTIEVKA